MKPMTFTETFTLQPLAPFNFDLTAQIFSSGDKQIRSYTNGVFHQVLRINGNLVLVKVASDGTVEQPNLTVELKSNNPVTPCDKQIATQTIQFIFNLDFDLCSFYKDVENDDAMHKITPATLRTQEPYNTDCF
jgi:hypothetical protein